MTKSPEFMGTIKLWKWLDDSRGGHGHHEPGQPEKHKLSHRKYEALLRDNYINPRRVREWKDVYSQLHTVVAEHNWRLNTAVATYEQVHLSLLSGLLGNVGCKSDEDEWYLGARGIKFWKHPWCQPEQEAGSLDFGGRTGRNHQALWPWHCQHRTALAGADGRSFAQKQLLEPHWEKKAAEVVALERATLYGLVVYKQ